MSATPTYAEMVAMVAVAAAAAELQRHPVPERDLGTVARRSVILARQIVDLVLDLDPPV